MSEHDAVFMAEARMDEARQRAIAAERGDSVPTHPPCPLADNKPGFRRFLAECWTRQHQPEPGGWPEFLEYLAAVRALSSARFALECHERQERAVIGGEV